MSEAVTRNRQFSGLLIGPASGAPAWCLSLLVVLLAGLGALLLRGAMPAGDTALVFVPAILFNAVICDLPALIIGCIASAISYNVLFLPPFYTFTPTDPKNAPVLVVFAIVAVTVRKIASRMREEADKARELHKIAERERLQGALLASVSHDLRTPLASILGSASALKLCADRLDEASSRCLIDTIEDGANSLNRLIANLLDMTRLEAGALQLRAGLIDLADIFGSALRRIEPLLPASRIRLALAPDLPDLHLDPVLLEQVFFNLFDNAAKYAPPGSLVNVAAWPAGAEVFITIANTGAGLPPDELERIFDKFHRAALGGGTSPDGGQAGTGLGLSICRGFIEAQGGKITAANLSRGGVVFTITFPILASALAAQ